MILSKIKTRYWVLLILFVGALVLSLVALALSMGEQYQVMAEEFRLVFRLSILVSIVLLIIGIKCFGRWRRKQ
jgi:membrane protein DedA with SNARE-associated domain